MTIIVSDHAADRMIERLKCNPKKIRKISEKAFRSTEPIPESQMQKCMREYEKGTVMRYYMGYYFFYAIKDNTAVLITMHGRQHQEEWKIRNYK